MVKIHRMVIDYAILFFVPSALCLLLLKDKKEQTTQQIQNRPEVVRQKKLEGDIMSLIKKSAQTTEEDKQLRELMNKGTSN